MRSRYSGHFSIRRIRPRPPETISVQTTTNSAFTVNDAAPVPAPSPSHGSYHWTFERLIAAGLVPLSVAPFASGSASPVLDAALCSLLLLHTHLGFQAILIDYVPNSRYPGMRKTLTWLLNGATLLVGVGLYEYETNDIGVTETVKRVWTA